MRNYVQIVTLLVLIALVIAFSACQKQSIEKQTQNQVVQDSLKIDSTKINANEKTYPPEPEGYKGIHQEEKE